MSLLKETKAYTKQVKRSHLFAVMFDQQTM